MRIKSVIIVSSLLYFMLQLSFAQDDSFRVVADVVTLKTELISHSETTSSIESEFIQEKHLWMLDEVVISKGFFLFKKDNNVRWQYNTPIEYIISIHNGLFTIVSNGKVSEFDIDSNPMFSEINKMIVTAIRGDFVDNSDFKSEFLENDKQYLAKLSPTNSNVKSMLEIIEIYFDKVNMEVEKVIFREQGDDFTSIVFINRIVNSELSDERFIIDK